MKYSLLLIDTLGNQMQPEVMFTLEHGSHCPEYMGIPIISLKWPRNIDQKPTEYKIKKELINAMA